MAPASLMDDPREKGRRPSLHIVEGGDDAEGRPDDDSLVAAFLGGDDVAFTELVRRNEALVLAIVRRYARVPDDARDLAQRTFLKAFVAARRAFGRDPQRPVPFRHWLIRVAVNLARNHLRNEARFTRFRHDPLRLGPQETPSSVGTVEDLVRAERAARMRVAVLRLPRRQREVLTLRLDAELPFAEIALVLGITENAAKVNFHHASRKLRELLAREERR